MVFRGRYLGTKLDATYLGEVTVVDGGVARAAPLSVH